MDHAFPSSPPLSGGPGTADALAAWTASEAVCALVEAFAADAGDHALARDLRAGAGFPVERLARLDAFSARWDTRQGRERDQAGRLDLTPAQISLVHAAAEALGMDRAVPPRWHRYDHVLILGGSIRGCLARTAYAAHLVRSGRVEAGVVTALGGHRPFTGDEPVLAAAAGAPGLRDEFRALDHAARTAFGLGEPERVEGHAAPAPGAWSVRRYTDAEGRRVRVVAAPAADPARPRANTADTYAFFRDRLERPGPSHRLLLVTTPINAPAQHATAVRTLALPTGCALDTAGVPSAFVPPALTRRFTATEYLLEVRSTIRALRRLAEDIGPPDRGLARPSTSRPQDIA
ncbi:hypothetical protein [Streptomyces lavendulocolor]|uniref:hypothetical protein n=1 Tax=Streptomyces lavendulocolor TaxID=67316 RepID=UPI0033E6E1C7